MARRCILRGRMSREVTPSHQSAREQSRSASSSSRRRWAQGPACGGPPPCRRPRVSAATQAARAAAPVAGGAPRLGMPCAAARRSRWRGMPPARVPAASLAGGQARPCAHPPPLWATAWRGRRRACSEHTMSMTTRPSGHRDPRLPPAALGYGLAGAAQARAETPACLPTPPPRPFRACRVRRGGGVGSVGTTNDRAGQPQ